MRCWQTSVPCSCKAEVSVDLLVVSQGLLSASRTCPHASPCGPTTFESTSTDRLLLALGISLTALLHSAEKNAPLSKDSCDQVWPVCLISFRSALSHRLCPEFLLQRHWCHVTSSQGQRRRCSSVPTSCPYHRETKWGQVRSQGRTEGPPRAVKGNGTERI